MMSRNLMNEREFIGGAGSQSNEMKCRHQLFERPVIK